MAVAASEKKFPLQENYSTPKLDDGSIDWENDLFVSRDILSRWLILRYLEDEDSEIRICSPLGLVLKTSHDFFVSSGDGDYDFFYDFDPIKSNIEDKINWYMAYSSNSPFAFVDCDTWLVRDMTESIATPESESYKNFAQIERLKRREPIRRFCGWALCVPDDAFPQTPQQLLERYIDSETPFKRNAGGRPRLQDLAAKAYFSVYPSGRHNDTWVEVERKTGFSTSTIKRALADSHRTNSVKTKTITSPEKL